MIYFKNIDTYINNKSLRVNYSIDSAPSENIIDILYSILNTVLNKVEISVILHNECNIFPINKNKNGFSMPHVETDVDYYHFGSSLIREYDFYDILYIVIHNSEKNNDSI